MATTRLILRPPRSRVGYEVDWLLVFVLRVLRVLRGAQPSSVKIRVHPWFTNFHIAGRRTSSPGQ